MTLRAALLLPLLVLSAPRGAAAEVLLKSIVWHTASTAKGDSRAYTPVERWVLPPGPRLPAKARALVTIVNRGPKAAEAVVLRYAVTARLVKLGEEGKEGVWTVPFWLEERRVSRVKPNQAKDVPIDHMLLEMFLKKAYRAGYWIDGLKIHVMVEPRAGEGFAQRILEQVLPVAVR